MFQVGDILAENEWEVGEDVFIIQITKVTEDLYYYDIYVNGIYDSEYNYGKGTIEMSYRKLSKLERALK